MAVIALKCKHIHVNVVDINQSRIDACKNSYAIAIIIEWDEFKFYDWNKFYHRAAKPAKLFDSRNLLEKKLLKK